MYGWFDSPSVQNWLKKWFHFFKTYLILKIVYKEWLTFFLQDVMNIVQELFYLQDNHEEKLLSFEFFFDVMFCPTLGIATSLKVLWQKNFIFVRFMKNISHEKWRVVDWRKQLQKICFCPEKNAFLCSFYSFQLFYCDQSKCVECFFFTTWKHFDFCVLAI